MECPDCKGTGEGGPVHVNTGYNRNTGRCDGYWKNKSDCFRCKGKGEVPDEMNEWVRQGKAMRKSRVESGELLSDAADRMGISSAELSAMECGRIAPANT